MGNYGKQLRDIRQAKYIISTEYNALASSYKPHHGDFRGYTISLYPPRKKPLRTPGNGLRIDCPCKALEWRKKAVIAWQWWDIGQCMKSPYRGADGLIRA